MSPVNIGAWWLQAAVVAAAAILLPRLVRLRHHRSELAMLQTVLVLILTLPLLQPWRRPLPEQAVLPTATAPVQFVAPAAPAAPRDVEWRSWLLPAIAAGIAARLLWLSAGLLRLHRYRAESHLLHPLPTPIETAMRDAGVQAEFRICEQANGPATFGWIRPVVLLPPRLLTMDAAAQHAVALHELLHIRRADWPAALAEECIAALMWFQPVVWWLLARIRMVREQVVDSSVVALTGARETYVQALVEMAAGPLDPDLNPAPPLLRRRNRLPARIQTLLNEVNMSQTRLLVSYFAIAAMLVVAGITAVSQFPLQAAPPQANPDLEVIFRPPSHYSQSAYDKKVEGTVVVEVQVNEDGEAVDARVVSGPQELRRSAIMAALSSRFKNRANASRSTVMEFQFKLSDASPMSATFNVPETPGVTRIRVGGNVQSQDLIHKVPPVYPPEAKAARIQGTARFNALIGADGAIKALQLVNGHPLLVASAQEAVKQWRYRPPMLNGTPAEVMTVIDINYTLAP